MPTISVPLTAELNEFVANAVRRGDASNKADVIRRALKRYAEDEAVLSVMRSKREAREGKVVYGDLKKILRKMP